MCCDTTMYGVNSRRHPLHPELTVARVCARVRFGGLFSCEQLRNNSSFTNNAQGSRTIVPLTAFVCGGGETGNEIMLRGLSLCARRAYRRAGPGREENTNHLLAGLAGLMEMREQFIQCNVSEQDGICGYARHRHPSPRPLDSNPPVMLQVSV